MQQEYQTGKTHQILQKPLMEQHLLDLIQMNFMLLELIAIILMPGFK